MTLREDLIRIQKKISKIWIQIKITGIVTVQSRAFPISNLCDCMFSPNIFFSLNIFAPVDKSTSSILFLADFSLMVGECESAKRRYKSSGQNHSRTKGSLRSLQVRQGRQGDAGGQCPLDQTYRISISIPQSTPFPLVLTRCLS